MSNSETNMTTPEIPGKEIKKNENGSVIIENQKARVSYFREEEQEEQKKEHDEYDDE